MLTIRNIRKVLDVHLSGTDYMIKNVSEVLDKSKSISFFYEILLYSHQFNLTDTLILNKEREYREDGEPYYSLHLDTGVTIMPSFGIHPKDMSNPNAFIYCLEKYFQELYINNYLKPL